MRGIRIWHMAALALSVPLLAAAVPAGCMGGLNPNFRGAIGQDAGTAVPIPTGYLMLGIFNETGWPGHFDFTINGKSWSSGWAIAFGIDRPEGLAWACDVTSINIDGSGEVSVPDQTGTAQPQTIQYNGGILSSPAPGDPMECGTLIKARVLPLIVSGGAYAIAPPGSTPQTVQGLEFHVFVELIK